MIYVSLINNLDVKDFQNTVIVKRLVKKFKHKGHQDLHEEHNVEAKIILKATKLCVLPPKAVFLVLIV
ncbi:hypothetical protein AM493_14720 [Flavobacterium akiainvivens]|uniref:Uncharacterized protein n=1 Tax=Flavobacterium akiainvivens TaxID=1202724 RepID=A0A0M8MAQ1_9FLAO|nr:hypothetical protein AM493_14720 [Flavobacterium akiainvivens]